MCEATELVPGVDVPVHRAYNGGVDIVTLALTIVFGVTVISQDSLYLRSPFGQHRAILVDSADSIGRLEEEPS
jgi:hypothetical protein